MRKEELAKKLGEQLEVCNNTKKEIKELEKELELVQKWLKQKRYNLKVEEDIFFKIQEELRNVMESE